MVLWHVCDDHHTALTTRGPTPSVSPDPVHYPGTYASPAQSPSRMVDTRQPSDLWNKGCLNRGILHPQRTCPGPHVCINIAAAHLLPKGHTRLSPCSPLGALTVPSEEGTTPVEAPLHFLPRTGAPLDYNAADKPQRAHASPDLDKGIERPAPFAHRTPTIRSSPLLQLLSTRELHKRESVAKRAQSIRVTNNKGLYQSMLKDHWPELRPASLPVYHRTMAPPPPPFQEAYPTSAGKGTPHT